MEEINKEETLKNGKILLTLKHMFNEKRDTKSLIPFLACLHDSELLVPMNAYVIEKGEQRIMTIREVASSTDPDAIQLAPDLLQTPDKKRWFPIFTQKEQIPEDYRQEVTFYSVDALHCLEMAHECEGIEGLLVDPYTESVGLPFHIVDVITKIPSDKKE